MTAYICPTCQALASQYHVCPGLMMNRSAARARVGQRIWECYAVETGSALPGGVADKLADAVLDMLVEESPPPTTLGQVAAVTSEEFKLGLWLLMEQHYKLDTRLTKRLDKLVALVKVEQADLDQLDADLDSATQAIIDKIETLNLPPADLAALNENVANLRALSAPAPVDPPADPPVDPPVQ